MTLPRRRFIAIAAGSALAVAAPGARAAPAVHRWRGIALGAAASITIAHPDALTIIGHARAEISRLERIFSLYRADSALSRLNATGRLADPPFEMLELLSLCDAIASRTAGTFDPTVQPLWALYAEAFAAGRTPTDRQIAAARRRVGWQHVQITHRAVAFTRTGMALTLNGIAQGYIADKVAALLERHGITDVLVDMGEITARGHQPDGTPWRVVIADPTGGASQKSVHLRDRAIATSAPLGTAFDADGTIGHILDPRTGKPGGKWRQVSVVAPSAARADGLSTAFCLMDEPAIRAAAEGVAVHLHL